MEEEEDEDEDEGDMTISDFTQDKEFEDYQIEKQDLQGFLMKYDNTTQKVQQKNSQTKPKHQKKNTM